MYLTLPVSSLSNAGHVFLSSLSSVDTGEARSLLDWLFDPMARVAYLDG
jgi:hypothetical protein